jgi:hypothetical protein
VIAYRTRNRSKKFAADWDFAKKLHIAAMEDEAWRRAYEGIEKDVWYKGESVGKERYYSDTLIMHRLNAERPNKYQYRAKVDGQVNGEITVKIVKFAENED